MAVDSTPPTRFLSRGAAARHAIGAESTHTRNGFGGSVSRRGRRVGSTPPLIGWGAPAPVHPSHVRLFQGQRAAAGEAVFQAVPVADLVLAEVPAEEHLLAPAKGW